MKLPRTLIYSLAITTLAVQGCNGGIDSPMTASPYDDSADEGIPDVDGSEFRYPDPYDSLEFAATTLGYTTVLFGDLAEFTLFPIIVSGINNLHGRTLVMLESGEQDPNLEVIRSPCEKGTLSTSNLSHVYYEDPKQWSGSGTIVYSNSSGVMIEYAPPGMNCIYNWYYDGSITYDIDNDIPGETHTVSATAEGPFFYHEGTVFDSATGYTGSIKETTSTLQDGSRSITITSPSFEYFTVNTLSSGEPEEYTKYEYEEDDRVIFNNLSYTEYYSDDLSKQSYAYEKTWEERGHTFLLTLDVNDLVSDENGNTTGEVIFDLRVQNDNARFITGHILFYGNEATIHYNKEGTERSVTVPQWK